MLSERLPVLSATLTGKKPTMLLHSSWLYSAPLENVERLARFMGVLPVRKRLEVPLFYRRRIVLAIKEAEQGKKVSPKKKVSSILET